MLWLRWRLTRNQWRRGGQVNAVITLIAVLIGLVSGVAGGVAGVLGGALALSKASPLVMMAVWDALVAVFLFLWMIGIVSELQRSEIIDLSRLLHLPVSLSDVFLLNYLASHLSLTLAVMVPVMLGLTAGLMLGRGLVMALLVPLVLAFFFMVTAWTYCLRGWLAVLMMNKRRRRTVIMGVTLAFVLLAQLPNLVMNVWVRGEKRNRSRNPAATQERAAPEREGKARIMAVLDPIHRYVPFLWLPQGARSLAQGDLWPSVWGAAGMIAIGALGLARAYRTTIRLYQGGDENRPAKSRPVARPTTAGGKIFVERTIPAVPEEAAAMAFANLRSMSRAPEVKMALAANVFIFAMLGAGMLVRRSGTLHDVARPFLASAVVVVTFFGLTQVLFNQFGFDREGFRALVLLPSPRRLILLGKNMSLLPVALAVFAVYLALITALAHLRVPMIVAAGLQFSAAFLMLSALGNLMSILVPFRVAAGSLKPTKTKATTQLMLMVVQMLFPLAMAPIFLPAGLGLLCDHFGWLPGAAVTLVSSALLVGLAALLYRQTLGPLGGLLQRREQRILQVVAQEVE
jgi:hypothetical protein